MSNRLLSVSFLLSLLVAAPIQAQAPSIDQMLSLEWPLEARVSPNGKQVAYVVQETNWEENAFRTKICLAETSSGSNHRLTRSKGSSTHPQWSPDGKRLAFTSDREGNPQIYLLAPGGGEAVQLTRHETGVLRFQWAPDGRSIAFTATDTEQTLDGKQADATFQDMSWAWATGNLISDLGDLRRYAKAVATGEGLISPSMQQQRLTWVTLPPNTDRLKYGMGIGSSSGWLGHTGGLPGYNVTMYYLPARDATLVVMVNSDIPTKGAAPAPALFEALARVVTPENVPLEPEPVGP